MNYKSPVTADAPSLGESKRKGEELRKKHSRFYNNTMLTRVRIIKITILLTSELTYNADVRQSPRFCIIKCEVFQSEFNKSAILQL